MIKFLKKWLFNNSKKEIEVDTQFIYEAMYKQLDEINSTRKNKIKNVYLMDEDDMEKSGVKIKRPKDCKFSYFVLEESHEPLFRMDFYINTKNSNDNGLDFTVEYILADKQLFDNKSDAVHN